MAKSDCIKFVVENSWRRRLHRPQGYPGTEQLVRPNFKDKDFGLQKRSD
jgi:hypothetical protein